MKYKKFVLILFNIFLIISVSGCGKDRGTKEKGTATLEEARAEFEEMCTNIIEYTKNADGEKVDKLVKCYPGGWDESTIMSSFKEYIDNGYPDFSYYVIPLDDKGEFYMGGIINSGPDGDQIMKNSWMITISFIDGSCKIDCCDEVLELVDKVYIYPEEMRNAKNEGRYNASMSENDWSFADSKVVVKNSFEMNAYCFWQNEDGSISIGCSIKNGTDELKELDNTYITICFSDGTGMIIDGYEVHVDKSIDANSSENIVVNVPKNNLENDLDGDKEYTCFVQYSSK